MAIDPIEFMKYDKISDEVYQIGLNCSLKFNVTLSKIGSGPDKKRFYFYKEYEYDSKSDDISTLITVKRSFDYFFSIENVMRTKEGDKAYIRIGVTEYMKFKSALETVISWFTDKQYKNLFVKSHGKLAMTSNIPELVLDGLPMGKFLHFVPCIIDKNEGDDMLERGVLISLSDFDNTVSVTYDRLVGLYYLVSSFNMFQSAQIMVGYLGFPTNAEELRYSMATGNKYGSSSYGRTIKFDQPEAKTNGVNDRVIGSTKNISSLERVL